MLELLHSMQAEMHVDRHLSHRLNDTLTGAQTHTHQAESVITLRPSKE